MKDEVVFLCVNVGDAYSDTYVSKLRNMIDQWYDGNFRLRCFTDRNRDIKGVECIDISSFGLTKWWPKMLLFNPMIRGGAERSIYFDLDTVIMGDLTPLVKLRTPFGICANFTRAAGHASWPCAYGSCVMTFNRTFGHEVYSDFNARREHWMKRAGSYGDQWVIEQLVPSATLLQDVMPDHYFLGYRDFPEQEPHDDVALAIFAGKHKPHNSNLAWVKKLWK